MERKNTWEGMLAVSGLLLGLSVGFACAAALFGVVPIALLVPLVMLSVGTHLWIGASVGARLDRVRHSTED